MAVISPQTIKTIVDPQSSYAEAYRKLQVNLDFAAIDQKFKVIQFVSSLPSEGKSTASLNLAGVYLELGKKVLLVDFDFRKPKVHRGFDLPNENGFAEFLLGQLTKEQIITHTKAGIDIIRRGQRIPRPNVALESKLLRDLMTSLREDYDVIIIDSPPVLVATDAVLISKFADATVFLVAEGRTHKDAVVESVNILRDNGANVVGIFANFTKHHNGTYGYGGKYAYYEQSEDEDESAPTRTSKGKRK